MKLYESKMTSTKTPKKLWFLLHLVYLHYYSRTYTESNKNDTYFGKIFIHVKSR